MYLGLSMLLLLNLVDALATALVQWISFAHKLGLPADWSFVDVLGLDNEFLAMVPQPVAALLFLFPITDKYTNFVEQKGQQIATSGQVVSDKVYFMKQTIKNACGAMALLHALANSSDQINMAFHSLKLSCQAPLARLLRRDELWPHRDHMSKGTVHIF
ncbi:hypothetical protein HPB50_004505 [Hyalomma asiaticum]|uniref:Uncharacterized protein n=1 Tax=Hyalomma asiaticum TaxID=266040 RepID=A0ACB7SN49_HYAAI|nr:hypothetical protein HPB50_004505 [Hyalomma asiaticum]